MRTSVESVLFALSGIIISAALLLLLATSIGCGPAGDDAENHEDDECVAPADPEVCPEHACDIETMSTLPGVTMSVDMDRCIWTVDEVRDGFEVDYVIEVASEIEVKPIQQDAGGCGTQVHPLDPFYVFSGNDQRHCLCDVGLCPATDEWLTLQPGTYTVTVEWSGRNWSGPSDTGNQPGEYFPPGTYDFEVSAEGEYRDENDNVAAYAVNSGMAFQLVE